MDFYLVKKLVTGNIWKGAKTLGPTLDRPGNLFIVRFINLLLGYVSLLLLG